jgi:hypothetical protein
MMVPKFLPVLGVLALLGCASSPPMPAGMKVGEFVHFACEGGKRFSARVAEGGQSVRVRAEGGYELDRKGDGVYEGDGWRLTSEAGAGAVNLIHNGKPTHKGCKPASLAAFKSSPLGA